MPLNPSDKINLENLTHTLKIKTNTAWQNFSRNQHAPNALVLKIDNIAQLQTLMQHIYKMNQARPANERILVRAAAGGNKKNYSESFSFSACANADVIIQLVGKEFNFVNIAPEKNIINAGASMQIGELDQLLYEKYNLTLPTSSLIPYVTVAGLSATAGHGTGKNQPSFAGLIRAMTLCLPNGDVVTIDNGNNENFNIIRAAHLGLFGIVLNVELECTEAKKLQCVMESRSIAEFIEDIKNGLFNDDPYISAMYVPTYQPDEKTNTKLNNVIIYRWKPVPKDTPDVNKPSILNHAHQALGINLQEDFHLNELLSKFPSLIPDYMTYIVTKLTVGITDKIAVGPWYKMAHYQTSFPHDIDDADYLFQTGSDAKEIVGALNKIVDTLADATKRNEYPLVNAVYLRFLTGTNGGLSTSLHAPGNHVCGIDMVSSNKMPGYEHFKNTMEKYFIDELHGLPHWGKYVPEDRDYESLYGKNYIEFKNTLEDWYKRHGLPLDKSPFLNDFFCKILKLPYSAHLSVVHDELTSTKTNTNTILAVAAAKKMLQHIPEDDLHGEILRTQLQRVIRHPSQSPALFNQPIVLDSEEREYDNRCCTII